MLCVSLPGVVIGFETSECDTVGESGGLARFTLVKNGSSTIPVSVWFSTANGTATGWLMLAMGSCIVSSITNYVYEHEHEQIF